MITRNGKRHTNGVHIFDGMPETLVHGAEEGANKIAEAVESAGVRVAKGAGQVAKSAGQASGMASELSGQLKGRVAQAPLGIKDAKLGGKGAKLSVREAKLTAREKRLGMMQRATRSVTRQQKRLRPNPDALVKAQLVKTSRELAHESSDLNSAVESLNKIVKANRKTAAKARGRTRLVGGLALGAALMYHLDAERGRERRATTARMLKSVVSGGGQPPSSTR